MKRHNVTHGQTHLPWGGPGAMLSSGPRSRWANLKSKSNKHRSRSLQMDSLHTAHNIMPPLSRSNIYILPWQGRVLTDARKTAQLAQTLVQLDKYQASPIVGQHKWRTCKNKLWLKIKACLVRYVCVWEYVCQGLHVSALNMSGLHSSERIYANGCCLNTRGPLELFHHSQHITTGWPQRKHKGGQVSLCGPQDFP